MKNYTGPVLGDAFGAALDAYWRGDTEAQLLIERDDGFIERNLPSLYFGSPDDLDEWDAWAVERATGRVLAAVSSPAAQILATTVDPCSDGCASGHHPYHQANTDAGRLPGGLMLRARYRNLADPWFDYLLIAPRDLEEVLINGPWRLGDYHGNEGRYAVRLVRR